MDDADGYAGLHVLGNARSYSFFAVPSSKNYFFFSVYPVLLSFVDASKVER